jgi:hypothetical protein
VEKLFPGDSMKSMRYRLVFWPLFVGSVVLLIANKGASLLWSTADGVAVALFVLGLTYASDKRRRYASGIRVLVILISVAAAVYWLTQMNWVIYILAPLFLLIVALVLFHQDLARWRYRRTSPTAGG